MKLVVLLTTLLGLSCASRSPSSVKGETPFSSKVFYSACGEKSPGLLAEQIRKTLRRQVLAVIKFSCLNPGGLLPGEGHKFILSEFRCPEGRAPCGTVGEVCCPL